MKAIGWILFAVTAIACAGDTGVSPRPPASVEAAPAIRQSEGRHIAESQALMQADATLRQFLGRLAADDMLSAAGSHVSSRHVEDVDQVREQLERVRSKLHVPSQANLTVTSNGTPVYPAGTPLGWVTSGTWLKYSNAMFTASSQYSYPVLLATMIRGNNSVGWTASSDDGLTVTPTIVNTIDIDHLVMPASSYNCNVTKVDVWGNSEHQAYYAIQGTVVGVNLGVQYQTDSRGLYYPTTRICEHTPLDGSLATSGEVVLNGTATAAVFWHGAQSSTVTDCPTSWSVSPGGIVNIAGGSSPDSRSLNAVGVGSATITASCRGVSASGGITVLPLAPVPSCGDPTATNYGEHAACTYPPGGGSGGSGGGGGTGAPPPAYQPPPPPPPTYCYTWVETVNDFDSYGNVTWTYYIYHYSCF